MQSDVYMGKMAEFAVWNWLKSINKNATFPDVSIYDYTDNNFFGADITFDSTKLHVKSCMAVSTYPNSWVFHPSDNLIHSPTPDDFLALVTLNHDKNFDAYVVKAELVTSIYDEPRKPNTPKKVIYEERLMSLFNRL